MLVDRYEAEDVFSRVPRMAARIDPVLSKLDQLLDDDELYQRVRADFGKRHRFTLVHGRHSTPVEVLLRMLNGHAPASVELSRHPRAGGPEPDPALVLPPVLGAGAR
jgi:hypothetical protein